MMKKDKEQPKNESHNVALPEANELVNADDDGFLKWIHMSLLSTRNKAFAKFIAKIIELNAQFPDYPIKSVRMDNASEFTSSAFDDYYMALGIKPNGLPESLIKHLPKGIFVHQFKYVTKLLERFYMDKSHPLSTPMVVTSLEVDKDAYRPKEDDEDILGPEVSYLSAIGALFYLANCTRLDIAFLVNLLARFSATPTRRHWNDVKHILIDLQGTKDLGLFFEKN
ncbi:uncharacterized protein LOC116020252 [Ipomoea triloba]|uniref:uncharacterized protein LOC116020252 n=1 Tax=Ipomoea triloba TaxID=35885 RepID=UPI00125DE54D|nr:uncharacterized protein LOC116020252 [Ipomoea triloba]